MKRIDFRTVWPIFNFWNASVVTSKVRDVQGVYYIALFLGVTYSQIVLYIFQSFLIDFRFISCFAKPFLMINHWMDDGYACITLCDLRLVGINWRHFIPPFVKKILSKLKWCCQSLAVCWFPGDRFSAGVALGRRTASRAVARTAGFSAQEMVEKVVFEGTESSYLMWSEIILYQRHWKSLESAILSLNFMILEG